jgi:hypothetical protein
VETIAPEIPSFWTIGAFPFGSENDWNELNHELALLQWAKGEVACGRKSLELLTAYANGDQQVNPKFNRLIFACGQRPGFPDLFLPLPTKKYYGLFIELKSLKRNSHATKTQRDMIARLSGLGYRAVICRGYKEAVEEINHYEEMA